MKMGEHMEQVIELLEELNGNDTEAKLKLLALVISEYMLNADVTVLKVSAGRMKVAVDISVETGDRACTK
ncbi:diguanylate phosphodiesterase [Salmonella enterica]|nr:diguanylate phosphodiesterase [Salmonella enterica]EDV1890250.1 diguanylate phosphodiesterase [Salmonella enterica subsp. enterica]EHA9146728.1 diguanylate phosphodiesterase [Salmonella enterica subsp. enterica serovar Sandiego]ECE2591915.1 diguanylate phosphodiesterase [Salmonella enterica]EFQ6637511.1 diguanylate phosphodiesterase [Salmonella enterica]